MWSNGKVKDHQREKYNSHTRIPHTMTMKTTKVSPDIQKRTKRKKMFFFALFTTIGAQWLLSGSFGMWYGWINIRDRVIESMVFMTANIVRGFSLANWRRLDGRELGWVKKKEPHESTYQRSNEKDVFPFLFLK